MKKNTTIILIVFMAISFLYGVFSASSEEDYAAMKGVATVKTVFDERESDAEGAAAHLKLIHQTFKDLGAMKKSVVFAVVFSGPSVRFLSTKRANLSPEDQRAFQDVAATVSAMAKDGIVLEVCLVAVRYFGVDPASVLAEVKKVPNGWVSLMGYQAQGYSLLPVY